DWPMPALLLIDGGKGQLSSALTALEEQGVNVTAAGLAKREEEIVIHKTRSNVVLNEKYLELFKESTPLEVNASEDANVQRIDESKDVFITSDREDFLTVRLPQNSHIVKLLQRIRNESHRFTVSYHTHLKRT